MYIAERAVIMLCCNDYILDKVTESKVHTLRLGAQ